MVDFIAVQINSSSQVDDNLAKIETQLEKARAVHTRPALAVLPECASVFGCGAKRMLSFAEPKGSGKIQTAFSDLAKRFRLYLVAGSTPIMSEQKDKYFAASLVYSPSGECISQYNKIHVFDVDVDDNTGSYRESNYTQAGKHLKRFSTPWGEVAQSICYDLRFAAMYQAMLPCNVVVVPSAFTKTTGQAHWHALLKARAIEMQSYVVAANQVGTHDDGRQTFGHSCIYSPWGELLSLIENKEGCATASFDLQQLEQIRQRMPVHTHKKERYHFE